MPLNNISLGASTTKHKTRHRKSAQQPQAGQALVAFKERGGKGGGGRGEGQLSAGTNQHSVLCLHKQDKDKFTC